MQLVGTGNLTGTLTRITAATGVAVFNDLVLTTGGTGLALQAAATGYVTTTSTTFDAVSSTMHSPVADSGVASEPLMARPVQGLGGDANRDLVVLHSNGLLTTMSGNGTGQFSRVLQSPVAGMSGTPRDLRVGNVDGDGYPDVVIAYDGANTNNLAIVLDRRELRQAAHSPLSIPGVPSAAVIGQFNAAVDPNPDVAVLSRTTNQLQMIRADHEYAGRSTVGVAGHRADRYRKRANEPRRGSMDRSRRPQPRITGRDGPARQRLGGFTVAGTFPLGAAGLRTPSDSADALALADLNEDGFPDVVVATDAPDGEEGQAVIVAAWGRHGFSAPVRVTPVSRPAEFTTGDFNNDGHIDVATANPVDNNITLLHGTGTGTFASPQPMTAGNAPRGVAAADFTNDGKPEIVVTNQFQRPSILVDEVSTILNVSAGTGPLTVTSTADSGPGSLREALTTANARAGAR